MCPLLLMGVPFEHAGNGLSAISTEHMRILFCISSGGHTARYTRYNAISRRSAAVHHFCQECGAGIVSGHLQSRHPESNTDWLGQCSCFAHFKSCANCWTLSLLGPTSTTLRLTGWSEWLNKTSKSMTHRFIHKCKRNWAWWSYPLFFAVQEVPQASTGFFSPANCYLAESHGQC